MPASTGTKRVKGKRIERPFIIGSEAWPLDDTNRKPDTPEDHTKGWRVYVKVPEGQPDISRWLKKVSFKIFHTYPQPNRNVEKPPFEIEETGWGGFNVDIRLHFVTEVGSKPEYRTHFLQLEPYGDEELMQKQKDEKIVRSEFLDFVEFNEPTESLWELLTDESQFPNAKKARGKGGKSKAGKQKEEDGEDTVELPETSSKTNTFSKEMEAGILDILQKAEKQVDEQLEVEKAREQEIHKELVELRAPTETTVATT